MTPPPSDRPLRFEPWMLPLIVAAIVVPVAAGFALAGPGLGVALGFAAAAAIAIYAARKAPRGRIETAAAHDARRHLLVVVLHELDEPRAIERVAAEAGFDDPAVETEVRVLAPARSSALDRWATDVRRSRAEAQRKLVLSVAALGKARVAAEAAVGDENVVQAVEDELRSFPADEVVLVTGPAGADRDAERAARELGERLAQPLVRVELGG